MFEKITKILKNVVGEKNELTDSLNLVLEERLSSPFWGYFITSWIVINWKLFYIALFVKGDEILKKTGQLSNEYLFSNIPNSNTYDYWFHFAILPFLVTISIFWLMPYLTRIFFKKNIRNQKILKSIEIQENTKVIKDEVKLVKEENALIQESIEKRKQIRIAQDETPEVIWEREYHAFEKNSLFKDFSSVVRKTYDNQAGFLPLSLPMVAFLDLNELGSVEENDYNRATSVSLTPKGKFFAKKYLEKNIL